MHTRDEPEPLNAVPHRAPRSEPVAASVSRSNDPGNAEARAMLELQRLAGNASIQHLVAREAATASEDEIESGGHSPVLDVVGKGGGEPLPPDVRGEMEGRLGADFGDVRVHRDTQASESARAVGANAYTVGTDVVFRSDHWDPSSGEGKKTIAHELSHVIQQASGPVDGSPAAGGINVSSPDDPFERAAEHAAEAALASSAPVAAAGPSAGPSAQGDWIQRQAGIGEEELEEEEETAQGDWVQRQEDEELEEEETAQGDWVQRQTEDEEPEEEELGRQQT